MYMYAVHINLHMYSVVHVCMYVHVHIHMCPCIRYEFLWCWSYVCRDGPNTAPTKHDIHSAYINFVYNFTSIESAIPLCRYSVLNESFFEKQFQ